MRKTLIVAAIVAISGCTQTRPARHSSVPVKLEPPTASSRMRESRQRNAEREIAVSVSGGVRK